MLGNWKPCQTSPAGRWTNVAELVWRLPHPAQLLLDPLREVATSFMFGFNGFHPDPENFHPSRNSGWILNYLLGQPLIRLHFPTLSFEHFNFHRPFVRTLLKVKLQAGWHRAVANKKGLITLLGSAWKCVLFSFLPSCVQVSCAAPSCRPVGVWVLRDSHGFGVAS